MRIFKKCQILLPSPDWRKHNFFRGVQIGARALKVLQELLLRDKFATIHEANAIAGDAFAEVADYFAKSRHICGDIH